MSQPLPSNPYNTGQQAVLHVAYGRCATLQNRHSQVVPCGHLSVLICARILGYMILEAPTDEGRTELATEIVRCVGDEDLQKLAEIYKNHLLRVCKPLFRWLSHPLTKDVSLSVLGNKGRTPTPTRHPSAPSFDAQAASISTLLMRTPRSHEQAKELVRLYTLGGRVGSFRTLGP